MSHFDKISECVVKVVKRKKRFIEKFAELNNFGWEKWLQMEMAVSLLTENHSIELEKMYRYDETTNKPLGKLGFTNCFIDLVLKIKRYKGIHEAGVELKVTRNLGGLKHVLADLEKISSIRTKKWNIRSVIGVLVYSCGGKETKYTRIVDDLSILKSPGYRFSKFEMKDIGIGIILIGWEVGSVDNMTREEYKYCLKAIREKFKSNRVAINKC